MRIIFISGPFRAKLEYDRRENIRRAEALALEVWKLGAAAICPHLNTAHFDGTVPDNVFLEGDLDILRRCDAVLMTDDFDKSVGAMKERSVALEHKIPVMYSLAELRQWLKKTDKRDFDMEAQIEKYLSSVV